MLINRTDETRSNHVKFIYYTGRYPNLCGGILTLKIDGKIVKFGYGADYPPFWESGGYIESNYSGAVSGEWLIDVSRLKEEYQKYAAEIDDVFNDNVPFGCCGGCI